MEIYLIGGAVRDRVLGIDSKDKDYVVISKASSIEGAYSEMIKYLKEQKFEIFLETPHCYTVRARFPKDHKYSGIVGDFVLARKEIGYIPNTRTPIVVPGTINNDVWRRDFTINSLYVDKNDEVVDLTGRGLEDLELKVIDTPFNPYVTFKEDPLRVFRAVRFAITKNFTLASRVEEVIYNEDFNFSVVSLDRVRQELIKCFEVDTLKTIKMLERFPKLQEYAFSSGELYLKPTLR